MCRVSQLKPYDLLMNGQGFPQVSIAFSEFFLILVIFEVVYVLNGFGSNCVYISERLRSPYKCR